MVLHTWWRNVISAAGRRRAAGRRSRRPHSLPPRLEVLEDRVVPALQVVSSIAPELFTQTSSSTANNTSQVTDEHALSGDGRYAVFTSLATDVVDDQSDSNGEADVFLHDRQTGINLLISGVGGSDTTTANGESLNPVISANGRFVAFVSTATNLISGQTGGSGSGVYLYDSQTGNLKLVSHTHDTTSADVVNADASAGVAPFFLTISDNGGQIGYLSDATNLVANYSGGSGIRNAYLYDSASDTNILVSHAAGSTSTSTAGNSHTNYVTISGDGSKVVLTSDASNLVENQVDPLDDFFNEFDTDIFVYDRSSAVMSLVSHAWNSDVTTGANINLGFVEDVVRPSITPNGRYIAYTHPGEDIVENQNNPTQDVYNVFRYDTQTGDNILLTHAHDSSGAATYPTGPLSAILTRPAISDDGARIAYHTRATNLTSETISYGALDISSNVFLWSEDATATGGGTNVLVSHTGTSQTTAAKGHSPSISADGRYVAFVTGDGITGGEVMKYDRTDGSLTLITHQVDQPDTASGGIAALPTISADGTVILLNSTATNLVTNDLNSSQDVFIDAPDTSDANDPPSFVKGPDQTILEDAGPQTVPDWATDILPGPPDEAGQNVMFLVTTDNDALFSALPSISPTGTLTYTSADDANGVATVTVVLMDDGGTANGGTDKSSPQTFTITVTPVNDAPGFTKGPDQTVAEDAGPQTVTGWATSISPGPPDEAEQELTFLASNDNSTLFSAQPTISPDGTLTYTPAENANGSATVTVRLMDDGGTANGGEDTSAAQTFIITVGPVNDPPSFTKGPDQTILEDAGPRNVPDWATDILPGPPDEAGQDLTFLAVNDNPALFSAQPTISPDGTLTFTSAPDANGSATVTVRLMDDGGTDNGGQDTSPAQTFTITVTPVNDAPGFTKGPNQTVEEDAGAQTVPDWATNISPGPLNEAGQALTFLTANDNPDLFSAQPTISPDGTLTYTAADNANGIATVTVRLMDDGGTANGGQDTSVAQTFTITVGPVNDAPSFTKGPDQTILEDAGPRNVPDWATDILPGPLNEAPQALTFLTANDNPDLFSAQPTISPDGTLTFTSAPDANGSATVTVRLMDDGGTANGGQDTSPAQTFTITVTPVNDAPGFTKGPNQTVEEDAGAQTVPDWATNISPGPLNEAGQALTFLAANDNPGLFSAQPTINLDGTLTYTPADNANGSATVTVRLMDDGGTANGGQDTSLAQTFTITINPVNDAPFFIKGPNQFVLEDAGLQVRPGWATSIFPGPPDESSQDRAFLVNTNNLALFAMLPTISPDGTLTFAAANNTFGIATVTVRLMDDGGTASGGQDTSSPQTFTITVGLVNDAPGFTKGPDQTVLEDTGPRNVPNWATDIFPGPLNEAGQALTFLAANDNPGLFSAQPTISLDGTLTYTPADDAYGIATVTVMLMDDGGTANGGQDTSAAQTFTITITPVNDAPSFTKGPDQTVPPATTPREIPNWATDILAGPPNEAGQSLAFLVSTDNDSLFSALPFISPTGTLTFTTASEADGTATVTVRLMDNGGILNGGQDTSDPQTFTITVAAEPVPPVITVPDSVTGDEGLPVPLDIQVMLADPLAQVVDEVRIEGVPSNVLLLAGTDLGEGVWVLTAGQLSGLMLVAEDDGAFTLRVTATARVIGTTQTASATVDLPVTIRNVPPHVSLSGASLFDPRNPYTLFVSVADPGDDTVRSLTVNWGDGMVETFEGSPGLVTHRYVVADRVYTISAEVTDEDGTFAAANTVTADAEFISPTDGVVADFYLGLLDREVDESGLENWTGMLQGGASVSQVVRGIMESPEYRASVVNDLYQQYLRRDADPTGLATHTAFLAAGGSQRELAANLLGSAEYFQRFGGGNNEDFLENIYRDVLGREIDAAGQAFFATALASGTSREQVALWLLTSAEGRVMTAEGFYDTFVPEANNPHGVNSLAGMLAFASEDAVIAFFLSQPEFTTQFDRL